MMMLRHLLVPIIVHSAVSNLCKIAVPFPIEMKIDSVEKERESERESEREREKEGRDFEAFLYLLG
jgi:Cft2 family RNA processing exonuclease